MLHKFELGYKATKKFFCGKSRDTVGHWLYTLPVNSNGYVPFLTLLYTLPVNSNGYVPFLILLYTLPQNSNGYVPFLINMLDTIVRVGTFADRLVTTSSGYFLHTVGEYYIMLML